MTLGICMALNRNSFNTVLSAFLKNKLPLKKLEKEFKPVVSEISKFENLWSQNQWLFLTGSVSENFDAMEIIQHFKIGHPSQS